MLIHCPFCGVRNRLEFTVRGESRPSRPCAGAPDAARQFEAFVYDRENAAGSTREYWHHSAGCRRWLIVTRDTLTHDVMAVVLAGETP
jgi:heterotetrameric sarcosine oxidase delta subunit